MSDLTPSSANRNGLGDRGTPDDDDISLDDVFQILSNDRRRFALHFILQEDGPVSKRELSERIAAVENGIPLDEVETQQRKRVYIALQQTHLPKLEENGLVECSETNNLVKATDRAKDINVYFDVLKQRDFPWQRFQMWLGIMLTGLVAVALLGLLPSIQSLQMVVIGGTGLVLMVSSVIQRRKQRRHLLGSDGPPPTERGE